MFGGRVGRTLTGLAVLSLAMAGCGSAAGVQHEAGAQHKPAVARSVEAKPKVSVAHRATSQATEATSAQPCGRRSHPPLHYQHVVWIVMENHDYSSIIGSSQAPYLNHLASVCGLATHFYAEAHPSLPNYIAMTSGSTHGIADDNGPSSHPLGGPSIFSQTRGHWRALQEAMPVHCYRGTTNRYAVRHNPAAYYTWLHHCGAHDLPFNGGPDLSARFTFITPGICHDMHDCSVAVGDAWLSQYIPTVLARPAYRYGSTVVVITWDEGEGYDQHIATLVLSPYVRPGLRVNRYLNHYSLLRTTENLLGYGHLGHAASSSAKGMRTGFHL